MMVRGGSTSKADAERLKSLPDYGLAEGLKAGGRPALAFPRWVVAMLLLGLPVSAQSPGAPINLPGQQSQSNSRFPLQQPATSPNPMMEEKRISTLNRMRQKSIVDDTTRLLILARQMNAESSSMSDAERMHKAAEIEKLAKSVKEKMSYAVGDNAVSPSYFSVDP